MLRYIWLTSELLQLFFAVHNHHPHYLIWFCCVGMNFVQEISCWSISLLNTPTGTIPIMCELHVFLTSRGLVEQAWTSSAGVKLVWAPTNHLVSAGYMLVSQARPTSAKGRRAWWTAYASCVPLNCTVQSNHVAVICHMTHYITVWVLITVLETMKET